MIDCRAEKTGSLGSLEHLTTSKRVNKSRRSQTEKDKYRMISLMCGIQEENTELIETDSRLVVVMGMEGNGNGEVGNMVQIVSYMMGKF